MSLRSIVAGCLPALLVPDAMANKTDVRKKEDEMPSKRIVNVECVEHLMEGFGGLRWRHWWMSGLWMRKIQLPIYLDDRFAVATILSREHASTRQ